MPDCELLSGCSFFNDQMANMPSTSNVIKMLYCNDNFEGCTRYTVRRKAGREAVLDDLFPNQAERAREILSRR
jgi:hypothetical protein